MPCKRQERKNRPLSCSGIRGFCCCNTSPSSAMTNPFASYWTQQSSRMAQWLQTHNPYAYAGNTRPFCQGSSRAPSWKSQLCNRKGLRKSSLGNLDSCAYSTTPSSCLTMPVSRRRIAVSSRSLKKPLLLMPHSILPARVCSTRVFCWLPN